MRFALLLLLSFLAATAADEKKPCPFCEITAGTRAASIVYRDDTTLAFMDNAPRNPGHVLVIPVQHADNLLELPPETARQMMALAQRIARAIRATDLKAEGIQLQMNTGKAAGQTVFHAHLHIIPRFAGEPEPAGEKNKAAPADLEAVAVKIRAALKLQN